MERGEPNFVPEWYKGPNISATGSSNSNHQSGSSLQSDEHNIGFPSRSRLTVSICDYDARRSLSFSERASSSFRKSTSSNGYIGHEKDVSSRVYNSFGRSHRDRDRDRERDPEIHERDIPLFPDNGFGDYPDVLITSKSEIDSLRRSQSMLSGRRSDSWPKRTGHESNNAVQSVGGKSCGINKSSFEREFPSLGAEEKHLGSDVTRVCSPGLNTAIHNLPVTVSTIIGADGWTSALAEVPPIVGENGLIVSSALKTRPALAPTASSASTGLNMAETVAQAPARARTAPQLPDDSQKIEELHRQQILKLRPMTPSMSKNLGFNPAEKSKTKGSKMADYSTVKTTSQGGNFKVLNREKNGGVCPTDNTTTDKRKGHVDHGRGGGGSTAMTSSSSSSSSSSSFCGERKPIISQAQNRNDFFNSLRKKTSSSSSRQENTNPEDPSLNVSAAPPNSDKQADVSPLMSTLEEPERLVPDEEEAAFLRSLGWEENAGEEAPLTPEEIQSFLSEYEKRMPVSKQKMGGGCLGDAEIEAPFA